MKVWDAIRNLINKIRRFYGMQELPTSVYDAISQLAENTSGQVQIYGDSYTRSHLQGSTELLPGELNIDALNAADEALLNAFAEVADINKRVQAKLKNAPADVMNDDVKRAKYIEELWAEESGVKADGDKDVKFAAMERDGIVNTSDEKKSLAKVDNGETKFSMSKPVEQTKDLIAVHNLNSPKLRKALELGGFPMPSIAVTRANMGHDKFGDITIVFGRDTIDPDVDSDNKLYGGDAYTPTFPAVRYEANKAKAERISNLYHNLRKKFGADDARPLYNFSDTDNLNDALNRYGGERGLVGNLKNNTDLM
jgi:hypothetical protein